MPEIKQHSSLDFQSMSTITNLPTATLDGSPVTFAQFNTLKDSIAAGVSLSSNTFTGPQIYSDQVTSRALVKDNALVVFNNGVINSSSTVAFDYEAGSVQTLTCGGAYSLTWHFINWPPTGNKGFIEVQVTNMGLGTLLWASWVVGSTRNWKLKNDTYTTNFMVYLADRGGEVTLKTSGVDNFLFWTQDAGTTIYGALL